MMGTGGMGNSGNFSMGNSDFSPYTGTVTPLPGGGGSSPGAGGGSGSGKGGGGGWGDQGMGLFTDMLKRAWAAKFGHQPNMADGGDPLADQYAGVPWTDPIGYAGAQGMAGSPSGPSVYRGPPSNKAFREHIRSLSPQERRILAEIYEAPLERPIQSKIMQFFGVPEGEDPQVEAYLHGHGPRNRASRLESDVLAGARHGQQMGTPHMMPRAGMRGAPGGDTDLFGMGEPHRSFFLENPKYLEPHPLAYGEMSPEEIGHMYQGQRTAKEHLGEFGELALEAASRNPVAILRAPEKARKAYEVYHKGKYNKNVAEQGYKGSKEAREVRGPIEIGESGNPFEMIAHEPEAAAVDPMMEYGSRLAAAPPGQKRGGRIFVREHWRGGRTSKKDKALALATRKKR